MSCSRSGVISGGRGTETGVCSALHCPSRLPPQQHTSGEGGSGVHQEFHGGTEGEVDGLDLGLGRAVWG